MSSSIPPLEAPAKWRWDLISQIAPPLFHSLVVGVVGYEFVDKLELALKERQATVAAVNAMSSVLAGIKDGMSEPEQEDATRRLAMFGVDAIDPLIMLGVTRQAQVQVQGPAKALTLIAINHKKEVCDSLKGAAALAPRFSENRVEFLLKEFPKQLDCPWSVPK